MSKKDISKILTSGSAKQRMLLIAEDIARGKFSEDRLLTDQEFNSLSDSFKKPTEIKLWNKFKRIDEEILNAITNLQGLMFEVKMHYSDLRGYILVWNSIENSEQLTNQILHEIKDPKERKRIAQNISKTIHYIFCKVTTDEEGYIEILTDFERETWIDESGERQKTKQRVTKEYSLWHVMTNVKNQATEKAIQFISWRAAILDYMDETGFNVKTYKELIDKFTKEVYTPVIGWSKYQTEEKNFLVGLPSKRMDRIKDKYSITPNLKELEVNEDIYNWFRKNFLGDE